MINDPVCGMIVLEDENSESAIFDNKVYYFCSSICKTLFDEDPNQYLEKEGEKMGIDANSNQLKN